MDPNLMLYDACCRDDVDAAKEAVRQGARISYTHYGRPLRVACQNDSINVFNWLISNQVSLEDYFDHIFAAAEYGYCDLFDRLMELGINPNGSPHLENCTPLSIAVKHNQTDIIDRLLALNVDVNKGCPLKHAKNLATADKLIVYGANVNEVDRYGMSVLQHQVCNSLEIVERLVDMGADVNYKNPRGHSALDFARTPNIRTFLLNKGAV